MSQFYHNIITDKSFQFLIEFNKKYNFILIGGWAVFLYTNSLKSKDIDIILTYEELGKIKKDLTLNKNERLKKYEIKTGEFDIDIYLPHYSKIGIPVEKIMSSTKNRNGFIIPQLEILLVLKIYVLEQRKGSIKGKKDELDALSLSFLPEVNWKKYLKIIEEFSLQEEHKNFFSLLKEIKKVPELRLNELQISKLKKKIMGEMG